jgi:hypothetical protein
MTDPSCFLVWLCVHQTLLNIIRIRQTDLVELEKASPKVHLDYKNFLLQQQLKVLQARTQQKLPISCIKFSQLSNPTTELPSQYQQRHQLNNSSTYTGKQKQRKKRRKKINIKNSWRRG